MYDNFYLIFKVENANLLDDHKIFEPSPQPLIGEVLYSEAMSRIASDEATKGKWLSEVYGKGVEKSQAKTYLLKLIEYNKIEIIEND